MVRIPDNECPGIVKAGGGMAPHRYLILLHKTSSRAKPKPKVTAEKAAVPPPPPPGAAELRRRHITTRVTPQEGGQAAGIVKAVWLNPLYMLPEDEIEVDVVGHRCRVEVRRQGQDLEPGVPREVGAGRVAPRRTHIEPGIVDWRGGAPITTAPAAAEVTIIAVVVLVLPLQYRSHGWGRWH